MTAVSGLVVPCSGVQGRPKQERTVHRIDPRLPLGGLDHDPDVGDRILGFFGQQEEEIFLPGKVRDRGWRICLNGGLNFLLDDESELTPEGHQFELCEMVVVDVRCGQRATYPLVRIRSFTGEFVHGIVKRIGFPTTARNGQAIRPSLAVAS